MTDAGLEELNNSDAVYDPNTSLYRGYSGCTMRITYTASVSDTPVYGDIGNPERSHINVVAHQHGVFGPL